MTLPTEFVGVLFYLALIVPGVVFTGVRIAFRGKIGGDLTVGARVLSAFVISAIFDSAYALALGPRLVPIFDADFLRSQNGVQFAALMFILLGIVIPAAVSWLFFADGSLLRTVRGFFRRHLFRSTFESIPTAWDKATTNQTAEWVRIRIEKGHWVGGEFTDKSFFSTYPEPRDLFIAKQWHLSKQGEFLKPVHNGAGQWVAIKDDYLVEWLHKEEEK